MKGYEACKANAPNGRTMLTVSPPDKLFDNVKVTCGFSAASCVYCVEFMR